MSRGRLEAFSDGVIAILITIMVLELKVPDGAGWEDMHSLAAVFPSYVLSFVFLGIYWSNHHHMLHATEHVDGVTLWANLHLLFWLSLVPFTTAWVGEYPLAPVPTAVYGIVLLGAALGYLTLQRCILRLHASDGPLAQAIGRDRKGKASLAAYAAAIPVSLWLPWLAVLLYVVVALTWLLPDRRIERRLAEDPRR